MDRNNEEQRAERLARSFLNGDLSRRSFLRRAAASRADVLEAAPEQLLLLAEAELADRAVGGRPLEVVLRPDGSLELVRPGRAELREVALVAALGERVCLDPGLGEAQADASDRSAGPT